MSAPTMSVVDNDRRRTRPARPHPKTQERNRAFNELRDAWIDAHPGAGDEAMWDDPEFVRAANVIDGRDPEHGLNGN
ncbi:hypothetical protein [Nonomuraea glycinis]|uniref:hypothetical protein n=1 Tax=Nonomuraea glycinis TaxID=2047744 RepID=UPI0033BA97F9